MSYSIKLPNGKFLSGIPDQMDPQTAVRQYMGQVADEKGYDPNFRMNTGARTRELTADALEDQSGTETFLQGIGAGMSNIGRGAGNILGIVDDEEALAAMERDAALMDTNAGAAGGFVGEMAALAPVGGAIGGVAKAAGAAGRALPLAGRAARGLSSTPGRVLSEGAVSGALAAAPGQRDIGALSGAVVSGGLGAGGHALRRALSGPVRKSPAYAQYVSRLRNEGVPEESIFVPLTAAAAADGGSGAVKSIYRDVLPAFSRAGARLGGQGAEMMDQWRSTVLRRALPNALRKEIPDRIPAAEFRDVAEDLMERASRMKGPQETTTRRGRAELAEAMKGRQYGLFDPGPNSLGGKSERIWNRMNEEALSAGRKPTPRPVLRDLSEDAFALMDGTPTTDNVGSSALRRIGATAPGDAGSSNLLKTALTYASGQGLLVPRVLARKDVQQFIMGDRAIQRAMKEALETNSPDKMQIALRMINEVPKAIRRATAAAAAPGD